LIALSFIDDPPGSTHALLSPADAGSTTAALSAIACRSTNASLSATAARSTIAAKYDSASLVGGLEP
jgi:hypothetical protein